MTRRRAVLLALAALALGAATVAWAALRLPARDLVRGHLGDVAATMFVYAGFALVLGRRVHPRGRALATLGIAVGVELGQLAWHAPGTAGELVLGNVFDPWDLVAYVAGVAVAVTAELRWGVPRATSVTLLCLAACGGAPASHPIVANEVPLPVHERYGDLLIREVGGGLPVAIVGGTKGLRAISADGARQRTLTPTATRWVLVDARANVIWFGNADGTEYRAIDLDQPADVPLTIATVVTGMPSPGEVEMVGPAYFGVSYPVPGDPLGAAAMMRDFEIGGCCANATVTLFVMAKPQVSGATGYQQNDEWSARFEHAAIPGAAFVTALASRPDHRKPDKAPSIPDTKLPGVDPANCQDADLCGSAEAIVGTRFTRVIVMQAMGDVGHITHRLYDTAANHFVDPEWGTWMQNAFVALDGSAFIHDGLLVRFDRGPLPATPAAEASLGGGWLGGSRFYGF